MTRWDLNLIFFFCLFVWDHHLVNNLVASLMGKESAEEGWEMIRYPRAYFFN